MLHKDKKTKHEGLDSRHTGQRPGFSRVVVESRLVG